MNFKEEFLGLAHSRIARSGTTDLLAWLGEDTDFFTAPASTRFHGCHEGGLVEHCLNVYTELRKLCGVYKCNASEESIAIVALFHDLCKIGCYKNEMRWRKNSSNQWEQYTTYRFDEDFAYGGHGAKSVYLIQSFIPLTPDEASAINCHMGQWDATTYSNPSEVYRRNMLAWLLHVADEAANYCLEE